MPWFGVVFHAEPCLFSDEDGVLLGFYTTRFVKAENAAVAERIATEQLFADTALQSSSMIENWQDGLSVDSVQVHTRRPKQVGWNPLAKSGGRGFTFYRDGT